MTTPASPAPAPAPGPAAASAAPGGGMPAAPAQGRVQPQDPPNLVAQGQERMADAAEDSGQDGLTPGEERQLGELIAKRDAAAAGGTVRLRVEGGHESVQVGHVVVGREWTDVPASMVSALTEGAADAGVQVTQDESES